MPFDAFIGNSGIMDRLRAKLVEGRFPHGLIFSGQEGIGKRTAALGFAKALNCRVNGPADFCDSCPDCGKINSGTHPDVFIISLEEEAAEIKIAQVRRLLHVLEMQPLEGTCKVFVIDPADRLNSAAANALLKGLEEPPDNSVFILLAARMNELPITVRSRCQVYNFAPLTLEDIRRQGITDELLVRWSQGSIGRARALDGPALKQERDLMLVFLEAAVSANESEFRDMLAASADLAKTKQDFSGRIAILTVLLSDLLYMSEGVPERIVNIDIRARLESLSQSVATDRVMALADFTRVIEISMKNYVNRQMLADVLALTASSAVTQILNDNPAKSR
jgi:DNA polymerase-3 subunit delta'